jgi:hypothetical protein
MEYPVKTVSAPTTKVRYDAEHVRSHEAKRARDMKGSGGDPLRVALEEIMRKMVLEGRLQGVSSADNGDADEAGKKVIFL